MPDGNGAGAEVLRRRHAAAEFGDPGRRGRLRGRDAPGSGEEAGGGPAVGRSYPVPAGFPRGDAAGSPGEGRPRGRCLRRRRRPTAATERTGGPSVLGATFREWLDLRLEARDIVASTSKPLGRPRPGSRSWRGSPDASKASATRPAGRWRRSGRCSGRSWRRSGRPPPVGAEPGPCRRGSPRDGRRTAAAGSAGEVGAAGRRSAGRYRIAADRALTWANPATPINSADGPPETPPRGVRLPRGLSGSRTASQAVAARATSSPWSSGVGTRGPATAAYCNCLNRTEAVPTAKWWRAASRSRNAPCGKSLYDSMRSN